MKPLLILPLTLLPFLVSLTFSKRSHHKRSHHRKFHEKTIKLNSPSLIQKTKTGARMTIGGSGGAITLNMPPPYYPKVMANPSKQNPIVIVPEIVYPREKKRVIVHHGVGMVDYYKSIMNNSGNMNPYYLEMAKANPYWAPFIKDNPVYKKMVESEELKEKMKKVKGSFKKRKGVKKFLQLV